MQVLQASSQKNPDAQAYVHWLFTQAWQALAHTNDASVQSPKTHDPSTHTLP
tara:strand:+ start:342 stop:497 length:156 start_codon:yes stop_codon:yes gene_type:complete